MLSPDGKHISYLKPYKNRLNLFVQSADGTDVRRLTADSVQNIQYCVWANNDEILYLKNYNPDEEQVLYAVNRMGNGTRALVKGGKSRIKLITQERVCNNEILLVMNQRDESAFDAYRLNVKTGKLSLLVKNPGNITEWFSDPQGRLRLAIASDGVYETLLYRHSEDLEFRPVVKNNFKTTIAPVGFSNDSCIYALSNQNRDKKALVELNCITGKEHKEIYSNPDVDVSEGAYSGCRNKLVYAGYETWKKERYFLDDEVKAMYNQLGNMLPDNEICITNEDSLGKNFIVQTFTDRNPGSYYLYTPDQERLVKLGDINSSIKPRDMAAMKSVSFKTRDGLTIQGYLTYPRGFSKTNLPVVVLPHGGPGARNSWGYNSEVQFLANRGYAVFQLNFRGSLGYGKSFWVAGFQQWGGKIQDDITDGVKWLISEGIADPTRIAIYGSSFGGYSALHGLCFQPGLYSCGVSNAGITNIFTYMKGIPPYYKAYQQMYFEMVGDPEKNADNFRNSSPVFFANNINVPVMIAQGAKDPFVNISETNQFVRELKKRKVPVTYLLKEDEGHFFKKPENRMEFYVALEKFLQANLNKNEE